MCLVLLALHTVPDRPFLLLGNRDEFHARPSAAAAPWPDAPEVIGGRDLEAGGSWLALHRNGRFATVTNVRLADPRHGPKSRGALIRDFVTGSGSPADFVARLSDEVEDYAPFNLVVGDVDEVWCVESPRRLRQRLGRGVHLVSNGPLDAPWPKMQRLRRGFEALIAGGAPRSDAALLDLLDDRTQAIDAELPDTGIPRERERFLSSVFVRSALYGTRASSLAWRDGAGRTGLIERRFGPGGERTGESVLD